MTGEYDIDASGVDEAVAALARRIRAVGSDPAPVTSAAPAVLTAPLSALRDHLEGPDRASASIEVFGAYGTPASRPLGMLLDELRGARPGSLCLAWRHPPDPAAHPRSVALATPTICTPRPAAPASTSTGWSTA